MLGYTCSQCGCDDSNHYPTCPTRKPAKPMPTKGMPRREPTVEQVVERWFEQYALNILAGSEDDVVASIERLIRQRDRRAARFNERAIEVIRRERRLDGGARLFCVGEIDKASRAILGPRRKGKV